MSSLGGDDVFFSTKFNSSICDPVGHVTGITLAGFSIDFLHNADCSPRCSSFLLFFSFSFFFFFFFSLPTLRRRRGSHPARANQKIGGDGSQPRVTWRAMIQAWNRQFHRVVKRFHIARTSRRVSSLLHDYKRTRVSISCVVVIRSIGDHMLVD